MSPDRERSTDGDLAAALADAERLRLQMSALLASQRQVSTLLTAADTRNGDLMKLLLSVRMLIESRDSAAALTSLRDLLVTVVGTADFVIYARQSDDETLAPIGGVGDSLRLAEPISLTFHTVGELVLRGELIIRHGRGAVTPQRGAPDVAAIVPLKVLDRVVGAIVIARLLRHREPFTACDREILGLLAIYAATAIIASDRRAEWRELPDALR